MIFLPKCRASNIVSEKGMALGKRGMALEKKGMAPPPFYVCADRYVISADLFLRKRGKFTIICAFKLRGF